MKCPSCGFPLSPRRTQETCPRCGTLVKMQAAQKAAVGSAQPVFFTPPAYNSSSTDGKQAPISPPVEPTPGWQAAFPGQAGQPRLQRQYTAGNPKLGFTIAGLCIVGGALLLVFVYFMAIGVHGNQNNDSANGTQTNTTATTAPSPTSIPSPTATLFPGQQYIDHAQMSGSQPPPVHATNTFKINQKMYVAFNVHPRGQNAVVCLVWYLNGQKVTSYNFKVGGNNHSSYAYAIFGEAGTGSVELYWAKDTSCNNGQLAQQVSFTVTK